MILQILRTVFAGSPYYLRVNRERVVVRDVSTAKSVEVASKIGIDSSDNVLSVGDPVDPAATKVLNPFRHPRVLIDDFSGGERVVRFAFRRLSGRGAILTAPNVIAHADFSLEGGLTQIEVRALREMLEGAGARKVHIWHGSRILSDDEVLDAWAGRPPENELVE